MDEQREFTLSVYTENHTGLMSRVVSIFTRRHINIESLTVSKSSMVGIHRFTLECTIEINDMQPPGARFHPSSRHLQRLIGKYRDVFHVALAQANAFAVFQVNCRNQEHISGPRSSE